MLTSLCWDYGARSSGKVDQPGSLTWLTRVKFRRQFAAQMRDSIENAFVISDVSYNHYLSFLKYLYSDKTEFSSEDAIEILKLADQHGLDRLKRICEKKIKRGIDIDNAA